MASGDPLAWWSEKFGLCEHCLTKAYCAPCTAAEDEIEDARRLKRENERLGSENEPPASPRAYGIPDR